MSESAIDSNTITSHEQDGRVLSGVGVTADRLAETMDRHAPEPEPDTPAKPADAAPATDAPVPSRGRQRFSDLTRERDEARGETAKERTAREALEREVTELRAKVQTPAQPATPDPAKEPAKAAEPTRAKPSEDEIGTKYQSYADFTEDLADWKYEQRQAALDPAKTVREILAQERERQTFVSDLRASQDRGRKAYPDFDTLLNGPAGAVQLGRTDEEGVERVRFITQHPASEHIQYAILKDSAVAKSLQVADAYTFGTIVAGLIPAPAPVKPAWTPPPSPHPTVGASSPTTPTASGELAKKGYDFDSSGYREKRAAERAASRGRK